MVVREGDIIERSARRDYCGDDRCDKTADDLGRWPATTIERTARLAADALRD
jgi:hypothetical protein